MKNNGFAEIVDFLNLLEQKKISYSLSHNRDETIMVNVAIPGERWEIEFFADGSVEVERFVSSGEIAGEEVLNQLFALYLDPESHTAELTQNTSFLQIDHEKSLNRL